VIKKDERGAAGNQGGYFQILNISQFMQMFLSMAVSKITLHALTTHKPHNELNNIILGENAKALFCSITVSL